MRSSAAIRSRRAARRAVYSVVGDQWSVTWWRLSVAGHAHARLRLAAGLATAAFAGSSSSC